MLVAFISSNTAGPPADDELDIPAEHPEFAQSGLKVSSRLRITRMTTLSAQLIADQPAEAMTRPDPIRV
ncbi:MAG: hypothetical protein VKI81_00275 [Synechococcaceae cyanobacterium]|nr:hypothetical protein [Synechococcaceae cyanobacterium]